MSDKKIIPKNAPVVIVENPYKAEIETPEKKIKKVNSEVGIKKL